MDRTLAPQIGPRSPPWPPRQALKKMFFILAELAHAFGCKLRGRLGTTAHRQVRQAPRENDRWPRPPGSRGWRPPESGESPTALPTWERLDHLTLPAVAHTHASTSGCGAGVGGSVQAHRLGGANGGTLQYPQ